MKIRSFFPVLPALLAVTVSAAEIPARTDAAEAPKTYRYNGKIITEKQFNAFYLQHKNRLYADNTGNFFLIDKVNTCCPILGQSFLLKAKLKKTVDDYGFPLYQAEYRGYNCQSVQALERVFEKLQLYPSEPVSSSDQNILLITPPKKGSFPLNREILLPVLITKVPDQGKGPWIAVAEPLRMATRDEFARYIAQQPIPKRPVPKKYQQINRVCPVCAGGKKTWYKGKYYRCEKCNGVGRITQVVEQ